MNPSIELNLALLLFLPWYAILLVLYCRYPRQRAPGRLAFDLVAVVLALAGTATSLHWSIAVADPRYGGMWRQVLGTSVSYGVFLAVLAAAWILRPRLLPTHRPEQDA